MTWGFWCRRSSGPGPTCSGPSCIPLHEKAAALLHSVARNHALIDGNERTAWLALRVFLRFNGVKAETVPPPVSVAGPFVEEVAQDNIDVPVIAKRLATWFPIS